ncbi:hypothetical protein SAMN05660477_00539 [Soonwooa buanensis]|uniref:Uncharacterized protein n=1 Tax=Soonwooa buanensis TaxID=619805 RepID=A0A1T5D234_9FLAO|nr:hypothetical protein [Soonwooa buanensis]SKB65764.1 hypothetical protein SAMN05660477_00539 [Soonwooa buanensis]
MIALFGLDTKKSIEKKRLVYDENGFDIFDRYFIFFLSSIIIFGFSMILYRKNVPLKNLGFEYYLLIVGILFCIYLGYRKATEKNLYVQKSDYSNDHTKTLIRDFCKNRGLTEHFVYKELIIFTEPLMMSFNSESEVSYVFIVENSVAYFAVLKKGDRANFPTLTTHLFLKSDMRKLLSKKL